VSPLRPTLAFASLAALALAALALPASAQDSPGCLQSSPCEMDADVTDVGFDPGQTVFTSGDWVRLSIYNDDAVEHTVALSGHGVSLTIPSYDLAESGPFQIKSAGTYQLTDSPTGDSVDITVEPAETFTSGSASSASSEGKGSPGLAPALLVAGLAGALAVARRRQ